MSAVAAPPAASPAVRDLLERVRRLPPADRATFERCLTADADAAPGAGPAPGADAGDDAGADGRRRVASAAFLAQLEREGDEAEAGRLPSYTLEEMEAEAERVLALPEEQMPPSLRAAIAAGRAAAARDRRVQS